jgi:glutamyl-tRNA synthetase
VIEDQVQGRVVWQNENLDDLVLLRSDGNPTYMLAVSDDHDMGVTRHPRRRSSDQRCAPEAHLRCDGLASAGDGAHSADPRTGRLEALKRHGALGVEAYRERGYLPAALRNYLVRLGWSHGDQEIFSTEEMIRRSTFRHRAFGSPVRLRQAGEPQRPLHPQLRRQACWHFEDVLQFDPNGASIRAKLNDTTRAQLLAAMPGLKERAKTIVELIDSSNLSSRTGRWRSNQKPQPC